MKLHFDPCSDNGKGTNRNETKWRMKIDGVNSLPAIITNEILFPLPRPIVVCHRTNDEFSLFIEHFHYSNIENPFYRKIKNWKFRTLTEKNDVKIEMSKVEREKKNGKFFLTVSRFNSFVVRKPRSFELNLIKFPTIRTSSISNEKAEIKNSSSFIELC